MNNEDIRKNAYRKWEDEGRPDGAHERHWLEAEGELRATSAPSAPDGDELETQTHALVQEYLSLGGKRLSKLDDNITEVRKWDGDPPAAEEFWQKRIATLSDDERKQAEKHLPSINKR